MTFQIFKDCNKSQYLEYFKEYCSVSWSWFTMLCNNYHCPDFKPFHHPKMRLYIYTMQKLPIKYSSVTIGSFHFTFYFLSLEIWLLYLLSVTSYTLGHFSNGLISLTVISLRLIHIGEHVNFSFFLILNYFILYSTSHFPYPHCEWC